MACHAQCSGKASEEVIYEAYLETWTKKEMASGGVAVAVAVSDVSLEDVVRAGELVACRMLETNEWQGTVGVCEAVRDACFRCLPFRIEDFGEERSAFTFRTNCLGSTLQHGDLHVTQQVHWGRWCRRASARTRSVCLGSLRRWCVQTACCTNVPAQSCLRL